jgi:prevent-host-death family protein
MTRTTAIQVGVRELKNRLTTYLRLAKADREVVVTERGKPIAVIQPVRGASSATSREARLGALAARGEITLPQKRIPARVRRVKASGRPLSEEIVAERR